MHILFEKDWNTTAKKIVALIKRQRRDDMDIIKTKAFETMPLEPDKSGYIDYLCAQYIVFGNPDDFAETTVGSVNVAIAEMHPSTQAEEPHFVIEASPIRLKWVM